LAVAYQRAFAQVVTRERRALLTFKIGRAYAFGDPRGLEFLHAALKDLDPTTKVIEAAQARVIIGRYQCLPRFGLSPRLGRERPRVAERRIGRRYMTQERRYLKPGWFTNRVVNPLLMRFGVVPTLAVRGRVSGQWRTVPVNVLELDGQRYLVAPRGDTEWVRHLRVTGRGELRRGARAEPFRATELPDDERPRVIEAYLARWGYQVKRYFDALPQAGDHPVFRIDRP